MIVRQSSASSLGRVDLSRSNQRVVQVLHPPPGPAPAPDASPSCNESSGNQPERAQLILHRLVLPPDLKSSGPCCGYTSLLTNTLRQRFQSELTTNDPVDSSGDAVRPWSGQGASTSASVSVSRLSILSVVTCGREARPGCSRCKRHHGALRFEVWARPPPPPPFIPATVLQRRARQHSGTVDPSGPGASAAGSLVRPAAARAWRVKPVGGSSHILRLARSGSTERLRSGHQRQLLSSFSSGPQQLPVSSPASKRFVPGSLRPSLIHTCHTEDELAEFLGLDSDVATATPATTLYATSATAWAEAATTVHHPGDGVVGPSSSMEGAGGSSCDTSEPLEDTIRGHPPVGSVEVSELERRLRPGSPRTLEQGGAPISGVAFACKRAPVGPARLSRVAPVGVSGAASWQLQRRDDGPAAPEEAPGGDSSPALRFVSHWGRDYGTTIAGGPLLRPGLVRAEVAGPDSGRLVQADGTIPAMPPWKRCKLRRQVKTLNNASRGLQVHFSTEPAEMAARLTPSVLAR